MIIYLNTSPTRTGDCPEPGKWQDQKLSSLRLHLAAFQATTQTFIYVTICILYHIHGSILETCALDASTLLGKFVNCMSRLKL